MNPVSHIGSIDAAKISIYVAETTNGVFRIVNVNWAKFRLAIINPRLCTRE